MTAPLPANEPARLEALRRYAILDTPPEGAFDRISRLVAGLLRTPLALVTLVDEHRQWFKSQLGTELCETPRDVSFCAHAILSDDVMVVDDATRDLRFAANPMVVGKPGIRFYAGAPIKSSEGYNLGTLCALDFKPRQCTPEEISLLRDLAALVGDAMELRLAVRQRNQQMTAICNLRSGVLIADAMQPGYPTIFVNPGFCEMTGYAQEEILGQSCRLLQGPETDPAVVDEIRHAIRHQRIFQGVLRNYRKDGTPFWNELTISPVLNESGELVNFVGLQTDVTESKESADQLRASYERLQELEGLRDSLTHMIIHDLRSPLTGVLGYLDLLALRDSRIGSEERSYVREALTAAHRIQDMITQLLDVNRLEQGQMPLHRKACDLTEILRTAVAPVQKLEGKQRVILHLPGVPVPAPCDADLIRRVVANLVSNALKFTPHDGHITVSAAVSEGVVRINVTDEGPGIGPEYHRRIFDKFGQIGRREIHSTGLGLTFCKLAVEAHGGKIGIDSVVGQGSIFWFTVPLAA